MKQQLGVDYWTVPVLVLLPEKWWQRVNYELLSEIIVGDYRVPEGFRTDGASVPRPLWVLFPPVGRYFVAAIVHDHALVSGMGWKLSNDYMDRVMRHLEIRGWRHFLIINAVRLNGVWQNVKAKIGLGGRYVN